jgi:hypothetical protein
MAQQFHEPCFVGVAYRTFAVWFDPFRMLNPEIIVDLLAKFRVRAGLVVNARRIVN